METRLKVKDIEEFELSSGGLGKFSECKAQFWHRYFGRTESMPKRQYKMTSGNRVHSVEKSFWMLARKNLASMFPTKLMKSIDVDNLTKRMNQVKIRMLYSVETEEYLPYLMNLSSIDAIKWIQLREFFEGDVQKCFKYWVPVTNEFAQYNSKNRSLVIIDRINIIPKGFFDSPDECLSIGDYKPGKFDENGFPKFPETIRDYDYGKFKRQLVFYACNLIFPGRKRQTKNLVDWLRCLLDENYRCIEILGDKHGKGNEGEIGGGWCDHDRNIFGNLPEEMKIRFISGYFYKTGQFLSEAIDNRSVYAMQKVIDALWETDYFPRNIDHRETGRCAWCDYKDSCIDDVDLLSTWGNAEGFSIKGITSASTGDDDE